MDITKLTSVKILNELYKKFKKEGSTTTSATVLHDLLRKLHSNSNVVFNLK